MKTKPKPPVKLPKAHPIPSIMYAAYDARPGRGKIALVRYDKKLALGSVSSSFRITPCAVLPCRTRQEAREIVRLRGMDAANRLLLAVGDYVASLGGKAIAAGGIEIQSWPEERAHNFRVAVRVTGRKPEKP